MSILLEAPKSSQVLDTLNQSPRKPSRVAILSDVSAAFGGAESILVAAMELYPDADFFTPVFKEKVIPEKYLRGRKITTSFLQKLPYPEKLYKAYLPLMPLAIELLDIQNYDVVFSSHHSMIKGVIPHPEAWHVCYCHSPARYLWDQFWTYSSMNRLNPVVELLTGALSQYLRMWDVSAAARVDVFLANSTFTAKRIRKFYNREARVLFPPVDTSKFSYEPSEDYYLMVGRLVGYKGFELAIDVFNANGKRLKIIGHGPKYEELKRRAGPNIELMGRVDDDVLIRTMNRCKGFIFPGKEDFGIVMAEAQSAGKPVIALNEGGAVDIVRHGETGILAPEYRLEAFAMAVEEAEKIQWDHRAIQKHAEQFNPVRFRQELQMTLESRGYPFG
ncbi:MAG TPA: glycosyltransferase [Oculatellaceae cyanobacterium]|jgi:glycosyltransferase involved in cell wall biosynthesis